MDLQQVLHVQLLCTIDVLSYGHAHFTLEGGLYQMQLYCIVFIVCSPEERVDVIARHITVGPFTESVLIETADGSQEVILIVIIAHLLPPSTVAMANAVVATGYRR